MPYVNPFDRYDGPSNPCCYHCGSQCSGDVTEKIVIYDHVTDHRAICDEPDQCPANRQIQWTRTGGDGPEVAMRTGTVHRQGAAAYAFTVETDGKDYRLLEQQWVLGEYLEEVIAGGTLDGCVEAAERRLTELQGR